MNTRRVIRKVERDHQTLDQQFWPVAVSLLALTAFLVGLCSVHFQFDDPRWRTNAYVVNGGVLLAALGLGLLLRRLGKRYGRHLLQAAVLLSILMHLMLGVAVYQLALPSRLVADGDVPGREKKPPTPEEESVPIPLEMQSPQRERPEDEPIEVADASAAEVTVQRDDGSQSSSSDVQARPVNELTDTIAPSILDRRDAPNPTPKMSAEESQLSRRSADRPTVDTEVTPTEEMTQQEVTLAELQPSEVQVRPTETAGVTDRREQSPTETLENNPLQRRDLAKSGPQMNADQQTVPRQSLSNLADATRVEPLESSSEQQQPAESSAADLAVNRQAPQPSVEGRVESERLDVAPEQLSSRPRPREHESDPDLRVAATPLPRANSLRKLTQQTEAEMVAESLPSDETPATQASDTALAQRAPSSSSVDREITQPADQLEVDSQRPLRMVQSSEDREAPSAGAIERRLSAAPSISSVADEMSEQAIAASRVESQEGLRPTDSSIQQQSVASAETTTRQQQSEKAELDSIASLSRSVSQRQVSSDVPTLTPQEAPTPQPRRAVRIAQLQSPVPIDSPAVEEAPSSESPTAEPKLVALDRGQFGEAGAGVSRNMRNELPGPERPSPVASGAAQRSEALENPEDVPTLRAGQTGRIARSEARERQPSAANQAIPVEGPSSSSPSEESALAAAGVNIERTRSDGQRGEFSADKGDLAVDVGPTRIMSEFQQGRTASGGGQPDLAAQLNQRRSRQPTAGGAPQISLAADVPNDLVAGDPGQGGGRPQSLDASPLSVGPRRADPGPGESTGQLARAETTGPAAEMSASDIFGPLALPRATGILSDGSSSIAGNATPENGASRRAPGLSSNKLSGNDQDSDADNAGSPRRPRGEFADAVQGQPIPGGGSPSRNNRSVRGPEPIDTRVAIDDLPQGNDQAGAASPGTQQLAGIDKVAIGRRDTAVSSGVNAPQGDGGGSADQAGRTGAGKGNRLTPNAVGSADNVALRPGEQRPSDIDVAAAFGAGGIGRKLEMSTGSTSRDARTDSELIAVKGPRFVRRSPGGRPQMSATAAMPTQAFKDRMQLRTQGQAGAKAGPQTDETIELGLTFLARNQAAHGGWTLAGYGDEEPAMVSDTAATGLALLAFQGAGYHHLDYKYADNIRDALRYLVSNQREDGGLFIPGNDDANAFAEFYSHGIAAIALCEAYGMTQDPWLREPAQRSLNFIVESQTVVRPTSGGAPYGGWRYSIGMGPDTSVSGWMLMALKSGELAKLEVPAEPYEYVEAWLDLAQESKEVPHKYRYNPFADNDARRVHGRRPSKTMTAVGLLMRLYLDWDRSSVNMQQGGDYLARSLPAMGSLSEPPNERSRDTYYWYYATQVMFHLGGKHWEAWNGKLQPLLVDSQVKRGIYAGSWDPVRPVPDRWAPHGGRLYVTTLNLLSLEVPYRHLPLYEDTAK